MDLIGALSSQLGVDPSKAEAFAGGVLGTVRGQVEQNASPQAAQQMDQAIPQLGGWMAKAQSMLEGTPAGPEAPAPDGGLGSMLGSALGGRGGGLIGAAAGALGGKEAQDIAKVGVMLNGLGLDPSKAALAAPLLVSFLKDKLPAGLFDTALTAAPMLSGLLSTARREDGEGGGIAGALGGLFG